MLATVAAVVLAIGGMFFPPLEALAAAAESEAVVFGAISAATATTVELSLKQTRDKGMVSLAFFAMPPAAKSLQRLIPIQVMDPGRTAIVDDATLAQDGANGLAIGDTATTRSVPLGFDDVQQYDAFGRLLHAGTEERYPATVGIMQGSSVTGVSYKTGLPFDEGRVSDYDVALAGSDIFAAARQSGVKARGSGIRTGPLHAKTVAKLGLRQLQRNLSAQSGRPTKFMIYRSVEEAMSDKPSIRITP